MYIYEQDRDRQKKTSVEQKEMSTRLNYKSKFSPGQRILKDHVDECSIRLSIYTAFMTSDPSDMLRMLTSSL